MEGSNVGEKQIGEKKRELTVVETGNYSDRKQTGKNTCDQGNSADGNKDKEETTDNEKQGKEKIKERGNK